MRTSFVGLALAVACSVGLSACGGGSSNTTPTAVATAAATAVPGSATQQVSGSPIAHVIVVTMENRTPDNLFGSSFLTSNGPYPGADVKTQGGIATSLASPLDPGHSYPQLVAEWNNGAMNGFVSDPVYQIGISAPLPANLTAGFALGYVPSTENILYHQLAYQYAFADRMFSSRLVASFPGHQFLVAGQSGAADNPPTTIWGCDSPAGTLAPTFGPPETAGPGATPCYDYQTLGDLLDSKGISWAYYSGPPGTIDGNIDAYGAIKHIRYGADFAKVSTPLTNINNDIQNCNLPSVTYINAPTFASDHSATLSAGGPGFVGDLYLQLIQTKYAASAACQYTNNTAMIVTWDDSGGWADHVAPPKDANGVSYGMRVPLLVLSPYARSGYTAAVPTGYLPFVSHVQHDYGSILHFIEKNYGLPQGGLGARDAMADDLSDMFNYTQTPIPPVSGLLLSSFQRRVAASRSTMSAADQNAPVDDDK